MEGEGEKARIFPFSRLVPNTARPSVKRCRKNSGHINTTEKSNRKIKRRRVASLWRREMQTYVRLGKRSVSNRRSQSVARCYLEAIATLYSAVHITHYVLILSHAASLFPWNVTLSTGYNQIKTFDDTDYCMSSTIPVSHAVFLRALTDWSS